MYAYTFLAKQGPSDCSFEGTKPTNNPLDVFRCPPYGLHAIKENLYIDVAHAVVNVIEAAIGAYGMRVHRPAAKPECGQNASDTIQSTKRL